MDFFPKNLLLKVLKTRTYTSVGIYAIYRLEDMDDCNFKVFNSALFWRKKCDLYRPIDYCQMSIFKDNFLWFFSRKKKNRKLCIVSISDWSVLEYWQCITALKLSVSLMTYFFIKGTVQRYFQPHFFDIGTYLGYTHQ